MGASESFMNHPASGRCWPFSDSPEAFCSVSFGEKQRSISQNQWRYTTF